MVAAIEEMLTTSPSPLAASSDRKARTVANGPRQLTLNTSSIRSSVSAAKSWCATGRVMPAALTRMSVRPSRSVTVEASRARAALSVIGAGSAKWPDPASSPATASALAWLP